MRSSEVRIVTLGSKGAVKELSKRLEGKQIEIEKVLTRLDTDPETSTPISLAAVVASLQARFYWP